MCVHSLICILDHTSIISLLSSVIRARDILADIKVSKGRQLSSHGRMQDVLLQAINKAQSIIETQLNGVSFCQEYVALGHLIQAIESNKEGVETLQRDVTKVTNCCEPAEQGKYNDISLFHERKILCGWFSEYL